MIVRVTGGAASGVAEWIILCHHRPGWCSRDRLRGLKLRIFEPDEDQQGIQIIRRTAALAMLLFAYGCSGPHTPTAPTPILAISGEAAVLTHRSITLSATDQRERDHQRHISERHHDPCCQGHRELRSDRARNGNRVELHGQMCRFGAPDASTDISSEGS